MRFFKILKTDSDAETSVAVRSSPAEILTCQLSLHVTCHCHNNRILTSPVKPNFVLRDRILQGFFQFS